MNPCHPSLLKRKIIHCDCDCFYAAVEILDNPQLKNQPIAVGGLPSHRGVIATASYEARKFGVRSAMPSAKALQLCPELQLIQTNMEKYRQVSKKIMSIYQQYSDLVEPLSLDEAYIDVTGSVLFDGSATRIAEAIRKQVVDETGITVSAGVAPNKFLAKIASDWQKPDGCFTIAPKDVDEFMHQLPVSRIFGVGPVTASKLKELGVETCGQLQNWSVFDFKSHLGHFGQTLYELCRGIDSRKVTPVRQRKSISVENTYVNDLRTQSECYDAINELIEKLHRRIERANIAHQIHKIFLKIRFNDFRSTTIEAIDHHIEAGRFYRLFDVAYERAAKPVRLLGVGIRLSPLENVEEQLSLFE